jgi:GTP-binding protein
VGSYFALDQLPKDRRLQIAVAGRSNVGKSSLLNHLLGQKKLAKVSSTPGKTRSLNFFLVNDQFYFVDLPGYGYAKVSKEMRKSWGQLIESYLKKTNELLGLVFLLDCRRDLNEDDNMMFEWLAERQTPVLMVITKTDKISRHETNQKVRAIEEMIGAPAIPYSVKTGTGKQQLIGSVLNLVAGQKKRSNEAH